MTRSRMAPAAELIACCGEIDIYLFDQLLKGRFDGRRRVLDAGCGDGRNLTFLLSRGFSCHGVDRDRGCIDHVRRLAAAAGQPEPDAAFRVAEVDALPFADRSMDAVICSAVLHFAEDQTHFDRMVRELWRVLAPAGLFFARLASNIGLEAQIGPAGRRTRLPDGSDRFVVDGRLLSDLTACLGGRLLDPLKTTVVANQRCMTTWCVEKTSA